MNEIPGMRPVKTVEHARETAELMAWLLSHVIGEVTETAQRGATWEEQFAVLGRCIARIAVTLRESYRQRI